MLISQCPEPESTRTGVSPVIASETACAEAGPIEANHGPTISAPLTIHESPSIGPE